MPSLFKPTRPHPVPANAVILLIDGKQQVELKEGRKVVYYSVTEDGAHFLKPGKKWAADVRLADGKRKRVRFSPNHDAASQMLNDQMLNDLLKKIENEKAGIRDEYSDSHNLLLDNLLDSYSQHQLDRGTTSKQAEQARRRCEMVLKGCLFVRLRDLCQPSTERWLAGRRTAPKASGGFGPQTHNHYVTALKAFGNWLVMARHAPTNPFRHLGKVNVELDVRHERRPLVADEFKRLLAAARSGKVFRKLSGPDRRMLYLVGGATGLRASELASLVPASFSLNVETPIVAVEAAYSKHRRRDEVPVHPDLVAELQRWLAGKKPGTSVWPGKWALHNAGSDMMKRDLEVARAAWLAEAGTPVERAEREGSDFLTYRDHSGRVADFHGLRHTFITDLVRAGVSPKDAKELARHSSITLTMDRYAHVTLRDTALAIARLVLPTDEENPAACCNLRATGTTGGVDSGAAPGAAAGGQRRGMGTTPEEIRGYIPAEQINTKRLDLKGVEDSREVPRAEEESTPNRSRTTLRFPWEYHRFPLQAARNPAHLPLHSHSQAPPNWPASSPRGRHCQNRSAEPCSL